MVRFGLLIAALVILLDQISKAYVFHVLLDPPRIVPVTGFFNFVVVWNRGVSFGILDSASHWTPVLLSAVAIGIAILLLLWLRRVEDRFLAGALGLVLGGAIGNVIDRVRFGAVFDFLDFHLGDYHWPAFNIADSAITVGVVLILIDGLFQNRKKPI